MSELRVDNIVSQDGSAAPIYSKGLNIGAGVTLTNNGDYVVGGALTVTGDLTVNGTTTTIDTAVTSVDSLAVDGNITMNGGKDVATTGKAIAMAMVFG